MGKSSPAQPPSPDYTGAAVAQGQANVDTARVQGQMNNPNIFGPLGSQTVTWNGDQPTINQSLTPDAQATLTAQQGVQKSLADLGQQGVGTAQSVLGTAFNPNLPNLQTSVGNSGPIQSQIGNGGPIQSQIGNSGPIQSQIGNSGNIQSGIDMSGVTPMATNAGMTGQQAILSRLNPQIDQQEKATAQTLANQGIPQGSEAWNNAMRTQGQQENDLRTQAALQGINIDQAANNQTYGQASNNAQFANSAQNQLYGQNSANAQFANAAQNQLYGQNSASAQFTNAAQNQLYGQNSANAQFANSAQSQGYNQNLSGAQFGNTANQQSLAQQLQLRNQPLNEITALESGSQIQMPQFQGYQGSSIAPAPIFGAAQAQGQNAMTNYGINSASNNANTAALSGLAGTGAMALAFSDRRLKHNIVRIGTHKLGIGFYEYDIFGKRETGVMADEVEKVMPSAVHHIAGLKMVDYGAINA